MCDHIKGLVQKAHIYFPVVKQDELADTFAMAETKSGEDIMPGYLHWLASKEKKQIIQPVAKTSDRSEKMWRAASYQTPTPSGKLLPG